MTRAFTFHSADLVNTEIASTHPEVAAVDFGHTPTLDAFHLVQWDADSAHPDVILLTREMFEQIAEAFASFPPASDLPKVH